MSAGRSLRSEALADGHDHQQASSSQSEMLFMQHVLRLQHHANDDGFLASGPPSTEPSYDISSGWRVIHSESDRDQKNMTGGRGPWVAPARVAHRPLARLAISGIQSEDHRYATAG